MNHEITLPEGYLELLERKRYSPRTIAAYTCYFLQFSGYFHNRDLKVIAKEEVNDYLLHLIKTRRISISQQNQRINAIKFYYEKVLGRKKSYYLSRPRKQKKLPEVLTPSEMQELLGKCDNIKHRCILMTLYSAGLRRSELINLMISDTDSRRMLITVRD